MPTVGIMVSLQAVSKTYDIPRFSALRSIDLEIAAGEFVAIVGKSGSGKSTLLHLLGGIDRPSSGLLRIAGTETSSLSESRLSTWRGHTIGFVFQFFQLLPTLTAAENVMLPMDFVRSIPSGKRSRRALRLLDQLGILPQAHKLPPALSGGEQQRVAIARALANDPPLILADEPTGNLDSHSTHAILQLFGQLAKSGKTVILVTHERTLPLSLDRIVELADGAILNPTH
ncbi:MAG TPA: ABC transporter ATP-binding protein [Acidobacteriaceae bacterium]